MAATNPEAPVSEPVLFAYDGSELAQLGIEQAGELLAPGRTALVLCVWQPADVGFVPVEDRHFDAQDATAVKEAAEQTAAHGASLAEKAGFRSQSLAVEAAPTWKGIVKTAEQRQLMQFIFSSTEFGRPYVMPPDVPHDRVETMRKAKRYKRDVY